MSELHKSFDAAVEKLKPQLGKDHPSWIGGRAHSSKTFIEDFNPAETSQLLGRFSVVDQKDIEVVFQNAVKSQKSWALSSWESKVALFRKAADLISERKLEISAIMMLETGKNRIEALGEVEEAADLFRYNAGQLEEAKGFVKALGALAPNEKTKSVLRPYGVFVVIAPFNFPFALSCGMSSGALLGGNAVILKTSQETPWMGEKMFEVLRDAGFPEGLFQVVHGKGAELGAALVEHPATAGVVFTGSKRVGLNIQAKMNSGRYPRPCFLELGGKNPCIVTDTADLKKAVEGVARSAFGMSGQKCSALSRVYAHEKIYSAFREALLERIQKIVVGNPQRQDVYMGPVINQAAFDRYLEASKKAHREGQVLTGAKDLRQQSEHEKGYYVAPTLVEVPHGHELSQTELFLPFLTLHKVKSFDEALTQANDVEYGLTAGIFTQNSTELQRYWDESQAGVLYANRESGATTGAWPGIQSFCGWKGSGTGGKGLCGPYYVAQYMREQSHTLME